MIYRPPAELIIEYARTSLAFTGIWNELRSNDTKVGVVVEI